MQSAVTYGTQKLAVDGSKGSPPCARELAQVPYGALTAQLGPNQVASALSADFEDALTTPQIEDLHQPQRAATAHPEIVSLFVKPQTAQTWRTRCKVIEQNSDDPEL